MELKDIRPAIARQNVKWVPTGEIADLICYYDEKIFENTFIVKRQD